MVDLIDIDLSTENQLRINTNLPDNPEKIWDYLTEQHLMRLWLADIVERRPAGLYLMIEWPFHDFKLNITIIEEKKPTKLVWIWDSEFVMDESMVTFELSELDETTNLSIVEKGPFDDSRWSEPRKIHADLWEEKLEKLGSIL